MRERSDVEDRLRRPDLFGEPGLFLTTVDVGDFELLAGEPGGMEDDEARAVGYEIGLRRGDRLEGERAVARSGYPRLVNQPLPRVSADGTIGDCEALGAFLDFEVFDLRSVGAPVLISNEKRDAAKSLNTGEGDIPQLPVLQFRGQSSGDEPPEGGSVASTPHSLTARDGPTIAASIVIGGNLERPSQCEGRTGRRSSD